MGADAVPKTTSLTFKTGSTIKGRVPKPAPSTSSSTPWWKRWWVWGLVGGGLYAIYYFGRGRGRARRPFARAG